MTKPAANMTIGEIAVAIRQLAATLRDRMPYLDPADIGAVLMCVGCWLTDAFALMQEGLGAEAAGRTAANMVAIAGEQLYGATGGAR